MATKKTKTLEVRTRRSGRVPGVIVGFGSVAFLEYDSTHWHVVRNLVGKQHALLAGSVTVIALIALTVFLCLRRAGHVDITSKPEDK